MEESVGVTQRIHFGILGVCAALLILAFSADRGAVYEGALEEVRLLDRVPLDSAVGQLLTAANAKLDSTARQRDSTYEWEMVQLLTPDSGNWMLFPGPGQPVLLTGSDLRVDSVPHDGSLEEIAEAVKGSRPVRRIRPGRMLLENPETVFDSAGCAPKGNEIYRLCAMANYRPFRDSVGYAARFLANTLYRDTLPGRVVRLTTIEDPFKGTELRAWILARDSGHLLVSTSNQFLRRTRAVWHQVKDLSVPEAVAVLEEGINERKGEASLLGITISEQFAVVGGPASLVAMLALLAMHLAHLRREVASAEPGELGRYAWAPLFPGLPGKAVSWTSVVVLPVFACLSILWRAWSDLSPTTEILSVALSGGVAAMSLLCVARLAALRQPRAGHAGFTG